MKGDKKRLYLMLAGGLVLLAGLGFVMSGPSPDAPEKEAVSLISSPRARGEGSGPSRTSGRRANRDSSGKESTGTAESLLAKLSDPSLDSGQRMLLHNELAKFYAINDPEGGVNWINGLDPATGEVSGVAAVFGNFLGQRGRGDWQSLSGGLTADARRSFAFGYFSGVGSNSVENAWSLYQTEASNHPDLNGLREVLRKKLASLDGDGFWQIVQSEAAEMTDSPQVTETVRKFFSSAEFEYPENATNALAQITDDSLRRGCLGDYIGGLEADGLFAFGKALAESGMEPEFRDYSLVTSIDRLFYKNPGNAARLATLVSDPAARSKAANQILEYAQSKGPEMKRSVEAILAGR
jgi:hypothetical protein